MALLDRRGMTGHREIEETMVHRVFKAPQEMMVPL
jgi:hypothetical protein